MKLTITTSQQQFTVEVDASDTIKKLKENIEIDKGKNDFPVDGQKLIYAGKTLEDTKTVSDYKIKEPVVIFADITKPKSSTSSEATKSFTGEEYERLVAEIMAMGYYRDQVITALRANNHNPDLAIEFLMNKMPETTALPPAAAGTEAYLKNIPGLSEIPAWVKDTPHVLPVYLKQIAEQNPELLQNIGANPEDFLAYLNSPAATVEEQDDGSSKASYIQVTPQEKKDIEQLKALGYPEGACIQAYFACGKNKNMAAQTLLSND